MQEKKVKYCFLSPLSNGIVKYCYNPCHQEKLTVMCCICRLQEYTVYCISKVTAMSKSVHLSNKISAVIKSAIVLLKSGVVYSLLRVKMGFEGDKCFILVASVLDIAVNVPSTCSNCWPNPSLLHTTSLGPSSPETTLVHFNS